MKDLRDLIGIIEEGQNDFDPTHPYFDGVWGAYQKIHNRTVPDAAVMLTPEAAFHEAKRRMTKKPRAKYDAKLLKSKTDDFVMLDDDN